MRRAIEGYVPNRDLRARVAVAVVTPAISRSTTREIILGFEVARAITFDSECKCDLESRPIDSGIATALALFKLHPACSGLPLSRFLSDREPSRLSADRLVAKISKKTFLILDYQENFKLRHRRIHKHSSGFPQRHCQLVFRREDDFFLA